MIANFMDKIKQIDSPHSYRWYFATWEYYFNYMIRAHGGKYRT